MDELALVKDIDVDLEMSTKHFSLPSIHEMLPGYVSPEPDHLHKARRHSTAEALPGPLHVPSYARPPPFRPASLVSVNPPSTRAVRHGSEPAPAPPARTDCRPSPPAYASREPATRRAPLPPRCISPHPRSPAPSAQFAPYTPPHPPRPVRTGIYHTRPVPGPQAQPPFVVVRGVPCARFFSTSSPEMREEDEARMRDRKRTRTNGPEHPPPATGRAQASPYPGAYRTEGKPVKIEQHVIRSPEYGSQRYGLRQEDGERARYDFSPAARVISIPNALDDAIALHQQRMQYGSFDAGDNAQRKHVCHLCNKRFSRPSSLQIHINTHTGDKPFECPHPTCGRQFSVNSNMRRHYRNHITDTDGHPAPLDTTTLDEERQSTVEEPVYVHFTPSSMRPCIESDFRAMSPTPSPASPSRSSSEPEVSMIGSDDELDDQPSSGSESVGVA
ncbi:hypothetical protein PUNSTDRAFT_138628 [Punctularia strigosozonata HHB-11173 SS5]|uniref:C2H2-type domain-containing protein n=1 Tax=Punctularia strigosozonata (strain HHB-11173) TaxID=741275 RepID=R7S1J9_PUNST|nr:uncharacterized protein PUNSTDRAFT_138628 [Punctularia strigosozonata HHB-11173 SS5]EIN04235.1 hypothetical protein PUNSTDRAFT_138628 [Punctularia strigosozonata HHB-11173 SS5]